MYRLAYRNFGDHEALVVNHSITAGTGVGIRWYEIRSPGSSPAVYQQGTYAPDATFRWMGSIAMDGAGDIALGYSVSSASIFPGIRFAGRVPSDPLGMLEAEATIIDGAGSQTRSPCGADPQPPCPDRWGDYSSMSVDPVDDCTFWYTTEYLPWSASFNWRTRIASFQFPSCSAPPTTTTTTTTSTTTTTTVPVGTCSSPIVIPAAGGTFNGTTSGPSQQAGSCASSGTAPEDVFQWTPTVSGTATIETCGSGTTYDTALYMRSGVCASGTEVACSDDACANAP